MCSSPKGSYQRLRQAKRKEVTRSDYEKYASMIERASVVYDRIEQEKVENQKPVININKKQFLKGWGSVQLGLFAAIKNFLLHPYYRIQRQL